ncbi:hypothetical protein GGQ73_001701 [Rhizobium skierniewicense]|uniref:Uncharacterized protein n=1 Tax=Rhizobium skierniewicense TaxID=984260 RepID=A0A7W6CEJ8_9HYPH|nr:hypothetical protein [Rhizobium skierniewicense]
MGPFPSRFSDHAILKTESVRVTFITKMILGISALPASCNEITDRGGIGDDQKRLGKGGES